MIGAARAGAIHFGRMQAQTERLGPRPVCAMPTTAAPIAYREDRDHA